MGVYGPRGLRLLVLGAAHVLTGAAPPELAIEAPEALAPAAERIRALEPARLAGIVRLVGLDDPGPPIQVILAGEDSDAARSAPPWVSGYAYGALGVVVLLPERAPSYPDSTLEELLRHEVAHVLVARAAAGHPVPRWFHEGLAMMAADLWSLDDRSRLTWAFLREDEVDLSLLERRFEGGSGEVARAYAVSGALVRDLFLRYGSSIGARILERLALGMDFDEAFFRSTGLTLPEAVADFARRQSIWYRWVPVLTSSFVLWLAIILLAFVAAARRRRRAAELRRLWEEEELWRTELPPN